MFVKIDNRIYDEKDYIKEVIWLKNDVKRKIVDLLDKDFICVKYFEKSYDHFKLNLFNEKYGVKVNFEFHRNKNRMVET